MLHAAKRAHVSLRNYGTALTRCIGASLVYVLRIASRSGRACNESGDEQLARTATINMRHDTWYRGARASTRVSTSEKSANRLEEKKSSLFLLYILVRFIALLPPRLIYDRFSRAFRITRCCRELSSAARYQWKFASSPGNDRGFADHRRENRQTTSRTAHSFDFPW